MNDREHLRVALFTDLLVYDYSGKPPEHPDEREADDLRKQADWLIERGWTKGERAPEPSRAAIEAATPHVEAAIRGVAGLHPSWHAQAALVDAYAAELNERRV